LFDSTDFHFFRGVQQDGSGTREFLRFFAFRTAFCCSGQEDLSESSEERESGICLEFREMEEHSSGAARVVALVCDGESRIASSSADQGQSHLLLQHQLLLHAMTPAIPDSATLADRWKEMVETGIGFQAEVLVQLREDGQPEPMLLQAMPLRGDCDAPLFLITLCSGLRLVLAGLDEVARCRAVLNTAVDAIITIDSQCLIASVNPATLRMFGYAESELLGQNVAMLMPEPWASRHDDYVGQYLQTGKASIIGVGRQIMALRRDGSTFLVHLAISEFTVRQSRYFTGIIRDLTDLEQVQKQLLQSERLAAIGQMVTGLAHESRNALQRAQACLDVLALDLQDQPEQLDLARRARTALQDLHRLYEEVRSYAAPIHLEFRESDLGAVWRKEWENLAPARRERRIRLIETCPPAMPRCEIDIHRMEQVFRNIFENAIHACGDQGCVTVRCAHTMLDGNPALSLRISDDGPGMKPEVCARVFEPFFTTKQKGTGLGMAITHRILSAHAGTISAGAAPEGGAEIQLVIPLRASRSLTPMSSDT
jgi:PAS domain S-box-containing protein